ncbi:MAG: citrate transporter [Bacteroidota bacterium]
MKKKIPGWLFLTLMLLFSSSDLFGAGGAVHKVLGIDVLFILFVAILIGISIFHRKAVYISLTGFIVILLYKIFTDNGFHPGEHFLGSTAFISQVLHPSMRQGEWPILLNLFGLLTGFAVLARLFEDSGIPDKIPGILPADWKGPFFLLLIIFVLSSFLDNIAAALIGGTIAYRIFRGKVSIGYIAGIVAASNAGGAFSVVGDTTTTMMWISGVEPGRLIHAFVASAVAFLVFAFFAARQQNNFQGIIHAENAEVKIDFLRFGWVFVILVSAILANMFFEFPAAGVWLAIVAGAALMKIPWKEAAGSLKSTVFLLALVSSASLMPLEELPPASWTSVLSLGFVSAFFDNIPLTAISIAQGGYDWGMLAYAVGFGGSMVWFGSSAGVAITGKFHEARNMIQWIRNGWFVILAYLAGFFAYHFIIGWHP